MIDFKDITITAEMLKAIAAIDEFKGQWRATQNLAPERLHILKQVATIESVGSSTRIEGSKLSDEQVEGIIAKLEKKSFLSRDEQEVAGYAEAMDIVFTEYDVIVLNENYIKQLHNILLKYSTKDEDHKGEYKKITNNVEAFDADGKSIGIVFQTATPFETPLMMKDLINWYNNSINEETNHPIIIISLFVVVFLAIHPFKDGNGRLSRILTTLLLLKSGYSYVIYSSMESIIEASKDSYYLALRRTQKTIHTDSEDFDPWVLYFLKIMVKQKDNLLHKVATELSLRSMLPALSRQILEMANQRGEITVKDIENNTLANRNTIKLHLKKLVQQDYLASIGEGRGARYIRKTT